MEPASSIRPASSVTAELVSEFPPITDTSQPDAQEEEKEVPLPTLPTYSESSAPNQTSSLSSPREESKLQEGGILKNTEEEEEEFGGLEGADLLLAKAFRGFYLGQNFGPAHDKTPPVGRESTPLATVNPQQTHYEFGDVIFDSRFDSGNMSRVEQTGNNSFDVFMNPDAKPYIEQGGYRTWFYFCVAGVTPGETLSITMRCMNNQMKLYTSGLKPCYRVLPTQRQWRRIPGKVVPLFNDGPFQITFFHTFNCAKTDATFFAFSYPLSYSETIRKAEVYETKYASHPKIYFHRETLAHSIEKRNMELWTISSHYLKTDEHDDLIPGLFPDHEGDVTRRPKKFKKPTVFLTSRVHPGETPGSYVLNGILDFLLNEKEEQARILRKRFVFKVIPILNVDGVARGYYRLDTRLVNLNRMYIDPTQAEQPTIYAAKAAIIQQHKQGNLKFYLDLHAHAGKKGAFIFGNALENEKQIENLLFPRLIALNSLNFDFLESNFSDKLMTVKDRKDGLSREGSGRVGIYKETLLPHCYTLECNYQTGKRINYIPPKVVLASGAIEPQNPVTDANNAKLYPDKKSPTFTIEIFEDVGRAVCLALLDYLEENPVSRVPRSNFKSVSTLRAEIGINNNINVLENRKIKQKAQQQQREQAIRNQQNQRSGSQTKPSKPARSASSGGKNSIVNLRRQNTYTQGTGGVGGGHIPHVHSEGNNLSGLGGEKMELECVKEEEKEGVNLNENYSDSSDGGVEIKKPVSTATSTKRLKKTSAGKSQLKKKSSGGVLRQPRAPEKKDSQESRGSGGAPCSKFKKDPDNFQCKIVSLDFNSALELTSLGGTPKVAVGGILGISGSGVIPTRYGSLPPSSSPLINSISFGIEQQVQPQPLSPTVYYSNSVLENSSLPPPASRRILHQNSVNVVQSAKRKAPQLMKPAPLARRNNPFKQAGVAVVLKNPVVNKYQPPFQEKMVLLSMPAE